MRKNRIRAIVEAMEPRRLLSGTYVVSEVSDFAITQPVINYYLSATPGGPPLQYDAGLGPEINRQAFLDTGTSGMVFSQDTTDTFQIAHNNTDGSSTYLGGNPVTFTDIGIGGGSEFNVSEPIYTALAPTNDPNIDDPNNYSDYNQQYGPLVTELNPNPDPNSFFGDYTDIFGMPVMQNKVVVMNPEVSFQNDFLADMSTFIYNPGTPYNPGDLDNNPGIPTQNMLHVKMSYGDFSPYTSLDPANATPPVLDSNPIIGPNPLNKLNPNAPPDNTPPIAMSYGNYSSTGAFLFDTGAQISFMSQAEAANLHVHYAPGTYLSSDPVLVDDSGNPVPNQEVIPIEGVGGTTVNAAAFVIDSLTLQTQEGTPIKFTGVPIMVLDVGLTDPNTGQTLVLDGDFGANFLVASMNNGNDAAFNWITFDQPNGLLGFQPAGTITTGNATVAGRDIFYNNSVFDGNDPTANAADDAAIATDKHVLLPGQSPTFANFTSYSKGINGIMLDIANLAFTPNASDFTFQVGNSNNPSNWTAAPAPSSIVVRPGAGTGGSSRVEITWADGAIKNEWLEVTVKADADTGLATPDIFFVGNLVGASGQGTLSGTYAISTIDMTAARNDLHSYLNPATITDTQDYNRDGRVDATDELIARYSTGDLLVMLSSAITGSSPAAMVGAVPATLTPAPSTGSSKNQKLDPHRLAFRLEKQRVLNSLQRRLRETGALISNPRARAKIDSVLRHEITSVRTTQFSTTLITAHLL